MKPIRLNTMVLVAVCSISPSAYARTINKLQITNTGQSLDAGDKFAVAACTKYFRPTEQQLKHYFKQAYPVESYVHLSSRYSRCYAEGTVEFSDGNRGTWFLNSGGAGGIDWSHNDGVHLFYKHNTWVDPFSCTYGLGDEPEC